MWEESPSALLTLSVVSRRKVLKDGPDDGKSLLCTELLGVYDVCGAELNQILVLECTENALGHRDRERHQEFPKSSQIPHMTH